jgi:hypothetical protein
MLYASAAMRHYRSNSGSGADAKVESTVLDVLVVLIEEMDQPTADIIDLIAEKLIFATVRSSPPAVPVCARTFEAVTPSLPFPCCLRCTPPATDAQSKQRRSPFHSAYDSVQ